MKESGINYFYSQLGLDTGFLNVLYTFEGGAGSIVASVSGGQSGYSGILNSNTNFWVKPGSGFFSGNHIRVENASGLDSITWTQIFVYEKVNVNPLVLFSSQTGGSGYSIGVTASNKPYFESFNEEPITAASSNNLSSKNAIAFIYQPNFLTIGYYNFNAAVMEEESFTAPFGLTRSDEWKLGGTTGYIDYWMYLNTALNTDVLAQWFSGFYARPTGVGYDTTTICSTGITGYQDVLIIETGVTGYIITPGGDEGRDYFTGAFPTTHSQGVLTGILSSGIYSSGVSGVVCEIATGAQFDLLEYQTGYAASFGMEKIQLFTYIEISDIVKAGFSYIPFVDVYNKSSIRQYSGYLIDPAYTTGFLNIFMNGVAQANTGWAISGSYLTITGADASDSLFGDLKSGDKAMFNINGTGYSFTYSGQEIFLNGVNLISGRDFLVTGSLLSITNLNTGISGVIFEYPIVLPYITGSFSMQTGRVFWRDTSNVYLNGIRQEEYVLYIEGGIYDLFSGNSFNSSEATNVYDNNNNFWE